MNADIPSRRLVLRGALAVGCSLCLPIALSGCDSQPGGGASAPAGAAPAGPARTAEDSSAATGAMKATQAGVQYQLKPKGEQKCGNCRHFIAASNTCVLVAGQISPEAWCIIWAKLA
ncbi:MAG: hypothetical protein U1A72_19765 [Sulfuritalea sp.]|nr:hypothetical protein [Sulfuritalea sp.]